MKRLAEDSSNRYDILEVLKSFGPKLEPAALGMLADDKTLPTGVSLLQQVGTKEALPKLKALRRHKSYGSMQHNVEGAIRKIEARESGQVSQPDTGR